MAPSLGEEGTKTITDLKRQMVLMEEENIRLFNKEEEKNLFQGRFPKNLPKKEIFGGCVSNNNSKFKKDNTHERWSNTICLMEIN